MARAVVLKWRYGLALRALREWSGVARRQREVKERAMALMYRTEAAVSEALLLPCPLSCPLLKSTSPRPMPHSLSLLSRPVPRSLSLNPFPCLLVLPQRLRDALACWREWIVLKRSGDLQISKAAGHLTHLLLGKAWNSWMTHHAMVAKAQRVSG
jgi:hypothetical protein